MIRLNPNSAAEQYIYLTLQEMKKNFDPFTKYLIHFMDMASREDFYFIADVEIDNDRYTKVAIYTNSNNPTAGKILLEDSGMYFYKVYGQNSTTNLDPTDTTVVAMIEQGTLTVVGEVGYDIPSITIPDNYVYYE